MKSRRARALGLNVAQLGSLMICACSPRTDLVALRRGESADAAPDAEIDASPDSGQAPACHSTGCTRLESADAYCATPNDSPSVQLGDGCKADAPPSFRFAVCSCSDLVTDSVFEVDSLSRTAPRAGASVAITRNLHFGSDTTVAGSVYIGGMYSHRAESPPQLEGSVVEDAPPTCDCETSRLLDIAGLVTARAGDNDNARGNFDPATLEGFSESKRVVLDCGRYYLRRLAGTQPLTLEARGRVALFVDGNIELSTAFTLSLQEGARVEIFVRGNVRVSGRLELSSSNDGNRVLLAVGGQGNIQLNGDATIDGTIYAPRAELVTQGALEVHGALFVRRAALGGETRVHYQAFAPGEESCVP